MNFTKIVANHVIIFGTRELAMAFEVAESTVKRWASGVVVPLPSIQLQVEKYIKETQRS